MKFSDIRIGALAIAFLAPVLHAANGTWTPNASGLWSAGANWSGGTVADGANFTADFGTVDLTADRTVSLDSARTIGNLTFGDANTTSAGGWILDNNGVPANVLTLTGTTPTLTVNSLGTSKTSSIRTGLAGTTGFIKAGPGTLVFSGSVTNTYSGAITIRQGALSLDYSNLTNPTNLVASTQVNIADSLLFKGRAGAFNSGQTLGNFFTTSGSTSKILVNPNGGTSFGLNLGALNPSAGSAVIIGKSTAAGGGSLTISTTTNVGAIAGNGRLLYTADGGATVEFLRTTSAGAPYVLTPISSYTTYPDGNGSAGSSAAYLLTGSAVRTAGSTPLVLKIVSPVSHQSLDMGGFRHNFLSGLLVTGTQGYEIKNGFLDSTTTTANKAITIQQYNSGVLNFTGVITDKKTEGSVSLTKAGPESLMLSGDNIYTGVTYIVEGVLSVAIIGNGAVSKIITTTANSPVVVVNSTAGLAVGQYFSDGSIPYGTTIASIDSATQITLTSGVGIQNAAAYATYVGPASNLGMAPNAASNLVIGSATLQYTGADATTDRACTFVAGKTATFEITDGSLSMPGATGTAVAAGLTKTGAGTLILTGTNTYTGDTTVVAGKLSVSTTRFADTSTVTIGTTAGAAATLKLAHSSSDTVARLFIDGVQMPAGTYGSTASIATHKINSAFDSTGAGRLNVLAGPAPSYAFWTMDYDLNGASAAATADPDGDQVKNSLEYVLGGSPLVAGNGAITGVVSGSNFIVTFLRSIASKTSDTAVAFECCDNLVTWPEVYTIGTDTVSSSPGVTVGSGPSGFETITLTRPILPSDAGKKVRLRVVVTP